MSEQKEPSGAQKLFGDIAPKLADLTDRVLFGEVWPGEELSQRDRSIVTVTALVAGGNVEQLPFHLHRALENGVTQEELVGILTHLAFYVGWPKALSGLTVLKEALGK